jgi:hypothetical protein
MQINETINEMLDRGLDVKAIFDDSDILSSIGNKSA